MNRFLVEILRRRLNDPSWQWFQDALRTVEAPLEGGRLLSLYTAASRRLGKTALQLDPSEKQRLRAINPLLSLDHWGADEAGRAALLLTLSKNTANAVHNAKLVRTCYENGDSREQQSWLRSLSLLPACERFVDIATDACRTNIMPLFESIACENPYPFRHFPELNFNQMVLKGLFNDINISRIIGLEKRFNRELSRMADDYVSEREAASRHVPPEIWLVIAPRISRERLSRVQTYLRHENRQHRYWAAKALSFTDDPASQAALERQWRIESDADLVRVMAASLTTMGRWKTQGVES